MGNKQYLNAFINNSATIRDVVGVDITDAPHKVVAYDSDGRLVLPAADGAPAVGIVLSDAAAFDNGTALVTQAGMEIDVLIKNIGLAEAGEAVAKGDFLSASADGTVKKAAAGDFILGVALTSTNEAGELVQMQITKSGYANAASSGGGTTVPSAGES